MWILGVELRLSGFTASTCQLTGFRNEMKIKETSVTLVVNIGSYSVYSINNQIPEF